MTTQQENGDEILRMALESGLTDPDLGDWMIDYGYSEEAIKKFADLVAAAERESCAIACEVHAAAVINDGKQPAWAIAHECAAAVRKLGAA